MMMMMIMILMMKTRSVLRMCGAFKASGMQDLYSASHQLHINISQDNCYSHDDRDDYDNEDAYDAQPPTIIGILMVTTTTTTMMIM